jgi:hypothetical protein
VTCQSIEVSTGAICGGLDAAEALYHSLKAVDARVFGDRGRGVGLRGG